MGGGAAIPVQADLTGLADGTTYHVRLAATRASATAYSAITTFDTIDGDPPAVALDAESAITASGFTLHGWVDPSGLATRYRFEVSGDGGSSWSTLPGDDGDAGADDPAGAGSAEVAVSATASGLDPSHAYNYRLLATNIIGQGQADAATPVTTLGDPATIDDGSLTVGQISTVGARLSARLNPRNADTDWHFEYGPDTSYGESTPIATAIAPAFDPGLDNPFDPDTRTTTIAASLSGLQPATTYHYRLVADNGTSPAAQSADRTFTTAPPAPTATTGAITGVGITTASVSGTVDTHGQAGTARFSVVQTDGGYSASLPVAGLTATNGPQDRNVDVTGLPAGAL